MQNILIMVINMNRSHERWASMSDQAAAMGLTITRVEALDGNEITEPEIYRLCDIDGCIAAHGRHLTRGEIGCYSSHVRAAQAFLDSGHGAAVVLEDDAELLRGFPATIQNLCEANLRGFDMIRLQARRCGIALPVLGAEGLRVPLTRISGATAYVINRRAAQAYVSKLLPAVVPFDHAFDRAFHLGIKVAAVYPFAVRCQRTDSTIGTTVNATRVRGLKKLQALAWRAETETARVVSSLVNINALGARP